MTTVDATDPARAVLNQAPPLQPVNLFEIDVALQEGLEREGAGWGSERARAVWRSGMEAGRSLGICAMSWDPRGR